MTTYDGFVWDLTTFLIDLLTHVDINIIKWVKSGFS